MMIPKEKDRWLLELAEMEAGRKISLIVILHNIALANVLILGLEKNDVLGSELHFDLKIGFRSSDLIVRSLAGVVEIIGVDGVTEVSKGSVLRGGFTKLTGAEVGGFRADSESVGFEEFRVFLL